MDVRRWRKAAAPTTAAVIAIAGLSGCGVVSRASPVVSRPAAVASVHGGAPAHVAVIVMENEEYGSLVSAGSAPYINGLARRYGLARAMYAVGHPSLPNYLALTGGSTFGIQSDCTSCSVDATSLVDQLERAHRAGGSHVRGPAR